MSETISGNANFTFLQNWGNSRKKWNQNSHQSLTLFGLLHYLPAKSILSNPGTAVTYSWKPSYGAFNLSPKWWLAGNAWDQGSMLTRVQSSYWLASLLATATCLAGASASPVGMAGKHEAGQLEDRPCHPQGLHIHQHSSLVVSALVKS